MSDYETPSARARRERMERLWPPANPKGKRTRKPKEYPAVEPIPDEADVYDPHAEDEPGEQTQFDTPA